MKYFHSCKTRRLLRNRLTITRKTDCYVWVNAIAILFNGEQIGKIKNNKTMALELPKKVGE